MSIRSLFIITSVVVSSHVALSSVFAQDLSNAIPDKKIFCLHNRVDPTTKTAIPNQESASAGGKEIKTFLTGNFSRGAKKVYPIACTGSSIGRVCSTGNVTNDNYLFFNQLPLIDTTGLTVKVNQNVANFTDLSNLVKVKFYSPNTSTEKSLYEATVETGEVQTDAVITLTGASSEHKFFGIEVQTINGKETGVMGQDGSIKLGTFELVFGGNETERECAKLNWVAPPPPPPPPAQSGGEEEPEEVRGPWVKGMKDPYGVVFDAKSLEPLPGVVMHILDENKQLVTEPPGLINKWTTLVDGLYNYSMYPGIYYLQIEPPAGYIFEDSPPLHTNAAYTYIFKDPVSNIPCNFYRPNQPIDETKEIQCLNIPLTPLGKPYTAAQSTSINYDYRADFSEDGNNTPVYVFEGRVSHPFTIVTILQSSKELGTQTANNAGKYKISIPISLFKQTDEVIINLTKPDLTKSLTNKVQNNTFISLLSSWFNTMFITDVVADTLHTQIKFDPTPTYLEGYAYDDKKNIIPKAIVTLRYTMTKGLAYTTKADENGYFYVPPESIPPLAFYLEFQNPNSTRVYPFKIYEFATLNKGYIQANNINMLTGLKLGVPVQLAVAQEKSAQSDSSLFSTNTAGTNMRSTKGGAIANENERRAHQSNPVVGTVIIIIFLVLAVTGVGVWITHKPKRTAL